MRSLGQTLRGMAEQVVALIAQTPSRGFNGFCTSKELNFLWCKSPQAPGRVGTPRTACAVTLQVAFQRERITREDARVLLSRT